MNITDCGLIAIALVLLVCLTGPAAFGAHSVYGQNVTQFLPSSGSITYHITPSSEAASFTETSSSNHSKPLSIIKSQPPSSSEALSANYTAASEFFAAVSVLSVDTSISRNAESVTGSTTSPFSTAIANESSSTVRGT